MSGTTSIFELLAAEQAEQATWPVSLTSAWHPRNESVPAEPAAEPAEPAPEPPEPQEPAEPAPQDQLLSAFQQFQQEVTQRLDRVERPAEPAPAEPAPQNDDFDAILREITAGLPAQHFDDEGYLTDEGDRQVQMELARRAAREIVESELAPFRQEREQERIAAEADALEEQYPQLQDEAYQEQMLQETARFCQRIGRPELAREPAMLEQAMLAFEARQRAAAETPASPSPTSALERGTPAPPAAPASAPDPGDNIVNLARSRHHRIRG